MLRGDFSILGDGLVHDGDCAPLLARRVYRKMATDVHVGLCQFLIQTIVDICAASGFDRREGAIMLVAKRSRATIEEPDYCRGERRLSLPIHLQHAENNAVCAVGHGERVAWGAQLEVVHGGGCGFRVALCVVVREVKDWL